MAKYGIEVNHHHGTIDWNLADTDFAMIRCGYRGSMDGHIYEDPLFKTNVMEAKQHHIAVGVYFFSQATSTEEAVEEADWVLKHIVSCSITWPVCFKYEGLGKNRIHHLNREQRTNIALAFMNTIRDAGYRVLMYATSHAFLHHWNTYRITSEGFYLWCSFHPNSPNSRYPTCRSSSFPDLDGLENHICIWEYGFSCHYPGFSAPVSLNKAFYDYDDPSSRPAHWHPVNPSWSLPDLSGSLSGYPLSYQNDEKREIVYADTGCTQAAGSLNPGEKCYCLGIIRNMALVLYQVDKNGEWKSGFTRCPEKIHAHTP